MLLVHARYRDACTDLKERFAKDFDWTQAGFVDKAQLYSVQLVMQMQMIKPIDRCCFGTWPCQCDPHFICFFGVHMKSIVCYGQSLLVHAAHLYNHLWSGIAELKLW